MKPLALLALLPLLAQGQIEVFTVSANGSESPAPALVELGTVPTGDLLDTRFRLRNTGTTTATLQTLRISGPGFSLQGNPTGPQTMTPNFNIDFRVRFQPSTTGIHNAFLTVNDRMIVVRGDSPGSVVIGVDRDGVFERVSNERPVDFGRIEIGSTRVLRFLLRNEASSSLTVSRIRLTGTFEGPLDLRLPVEIAPGATAAFGVRFAPARALVYRGTLEVDERVIQLEGLAIDAPLPSADLLFGNAGSGQQATLRILFKAPPLNRGIATLKMTFQPLAGTQDDPGAVLLPDSKRETSLTIQAGETGRDITFQTGTTAARIRFRLEESGRLLGESAPIEIPAAPVRLSSVRASRQAGSIELLISGFDNARSVSEALFTFHDRSGQPIGSEIRAQVQDAFASFFRESALGGIFQLRAVFPVTGDAAQITGVQVEMRNSAGPARSDRVGF